MSFYYCMSLQLLLVQYTSSQDNWLSHVKENVELVTFRKLVVLKIGQGYDVTVEVVP